MDIQDTKTVRALALDAAVRSLTRAHGGMSTMNPDMDQIRVRADAFAAFISTGRWPGH